MPPYFYRLYGLSIASDLDLPELEGGEVGEPDIRIVLASREEAGERLEIEGIATYTVSGGDRIAVDIQPQAEPSEVRLFLLGTAMGIALHQRGDLPLHASSVTIGDKAALFMGPSGMGKSSLAAWLARRGCEVMADDVTVVRFDEGDPMAIPGLNRMRLWRDAAERFDLPVSDLPRSFPSDPAYDKFDVSPTALGGVVDLPAPIAAIYLLDWGEAVSIEALTGAAAVEALFANTYRGEYVETSGKAPDHMRNCVTLASTAPIYRFARPLDLARIEQGNLALLDHIGRVD